MKSKLRFSAPRRQRGQSILWFLMTVAACCCVLALVYNIGQVSNKKEETVNAADAAALSGAMVEARMLNFMAYTNRATIANEVTIAQAVSFDSWMQYNNQITTWMSRYTSIIPIINGITANIATAVQLFTNGVHAAAQGAIYGSEAVNLMLRAARTAAYVAGLTAPNDIAGKVAQANKTLAPHYDLSARTLTMPLAAVRNVDAWRSFTKDYTGNDRGEVKEVVLNSRDPFSTKRTAGSLIDTINTFTRFGFTEFHKTSGTTELKDFDKWEAQDSLDQEVLLPSVCGSFPFYYPCLQAQPVPGIPIGYGRVDANSNGSTGENLCNEGIFDLFGLSPPVPTTNCYYAELNAKNLSWSGLSSIRDLQKNAPRETPCELNNRANGAALSFVMAVQKPAAAARTLENMGTQNRDVTGPQGSPAMRDDLPAGGKLNQLTAISAACVFFRRPPRDATSAKLSREDGKIELASLYNPYWQARLSAPDSEFTSQLYLQLGQPGLNAVTQ